MEDGKFVFKCVPEVPVFYPTMDEFKDPLEYIAKIRSVGEQYGICKIKPPTDWHPPFCLDVDNFKFTPRVQKLNELDGLTRLKLNFIDQIVKYWNIRGISLKVFYLEQRVVDIYALYKIVELEGGFDHVCSEEKWNFLAGCMGYVNFKLSGAVLREHYEKWLKPFAIFQALVGENGGNQSVKTKENKAIHIEKDSSSSQLNVSTKQSKCSSSDDNKSNIQENKAIHVKQESSSSQLNLSTKQNKCSSSDDKSNTVVVIRRPVGRPRKYPCNGALIKCETGPKKKGSKMIKKKRVVKIVKCCQKCGSSKFKKTILICNVCKLGFHKSCTTISLSTVFKSKFVCYDCTVSKVIDPDDDFGFDDADRDYTLQQFGEHADQVKYNYFKMPVHSVPAKTIEQEYWKIVSSVDTTLTAEYGADIHTGKFGSGFPTNSEMSRNKNENFYQTYVEDNWNLNNIPVSKNSMFNFIDLDVSDMKIPWLYIGMCFSTFCWHNEDHWTYSINYLHWGESKTWYSVPGGSADIFEETMKNILPELFHLQPDLLHQLVTILNPNVLMKAANIPIYGINQSAGEFIITFPRSYHMGFSHGFNCAEAVNFISPDWIPMGRKCIDHYSSLKRMCVFSQDELIMNIINSCDDITPQAAQYIYNDFIEMVESEKSNRRALLNWGITVADFIQFENQVDNYRLCTVCNTTIYVSAVTCSCDLKKLTCLRHFKEHCSCSPESHIFKYRFALDDFLPMLERIKSKQGN